jgi:hypothetical protein
MIVSSLLMPEVLSSFSSSLCVMMSRRTWSCSCEVQFQPEAPAMCPSP